MGQNRPLLWIQLLSLFILLTSSIIFTPFVPAESEKSIPLWQDDYKYHQTINLPIETDSDQAIHQPIDMKVTFEDPCWGINETHHSIRVVSLHEGSWDELEVQIYNIKKSDETTIISSNIIFLIPSYATGDETYHLFYDDEKKQAPGYVDRVQLIDKYYYFEPISGISVEGDYYEIQENDDIVYGVGQKGRVLNRHLSQIAIRMKPDTKKFDMTKTDLLASFCFAYQDGPEESDEVASDQELVAKEILVDGNLMVQFRITSKSKNDKLLTSNIYTYYYQPGDDKKISVHVQHEVKEDIVVSGVKNVDGRFGTIISYHSKSANVKKMVFGEILPFLYVSMDEGTREYSLNLNPSSSQREWIISAEDNCDLGPGAWIAYGEGDIGKTHGLIFSSNTGIVKNETSQRDGIEIKVAEKEYLNVIGAEVDYVSIAFGRNAYDPKSGHDLTIDKGLIVNFDVEFYSTLTGGYEKIEEESDFFKKLIPLRSLEITEGSGDRNIHTLTVIPHLSSRILSYPLLRNFTGRSLPVLIAELYQNGTLIAEEMVEKPFIGTQYFKFPKLEPETYQVKIYRLQANDERAYIGFGRINLGEDASLHIYCTWEQKVSISLFDQFGNGISNVTMEIWQGSHLVSSVQSSSFSEFVIAVPFNLFKSYVTTDLKNITLEDLFQRANPYVLKSYYKGFTVFDDTFDLFSPSIEISFSLYDVIVEVTDSLGLPPGINVVPVITSDEMKKPVRLQPSTGLNHGRFQFSDIPKASYIARISYAGYSNEKLFSVPESGSVIPLRFLALNQLILKPLTSRGESLNRNDFMVQIFRNGNEIDSFSTDEQINLPPGSYVLSIYKDDQLIGSEIVELTFDKTISVVTILPSIIYLVVTFIGIILLAYIILFFYFKRISLNTALKLVILGLVLVGLMQPWWTFHGISTDGSIEKSSDMYLYPPTMIEEYRVENTRYLSLATIPEMFTDFVEILLFIIIGGLSLLLISFLPNMILKKRFEFILVACGIIFMILVSIAFFLGMSQIAELSLGSLHGSTSLQISPPNSPEVMVSASWGLASGFYIVFLGACIAVFAGVLDYLNKRNIISKLKNKINEKNE